MNDKEPKVSVPVCLSCENHIHNCKEGYDKLGHSLCGCYVCHSATLVPPASEGKVECPFDCTELPMCDKCVVRGCNHSSVDILSSKCPNYGLKECKLVGCPFHDTSMKTNEPSREIGDIEKIIKNGLAYFEENALDGEKAEDGWKSIAPDFAWEIVSQWITEKFPIFIAAAKAEGYKEGAQDGEGTKNGVKRYQMGFDAGKAEGGKEMLEKMWQYAHDWATMIEKYGGINLKEWEGEDEIAASIMSYMRGEHLSSENKPK